jgi:dihydroflavonol-4-reductase
VLVLVTGGTGFVGSHSVAALVKAGHEVRVLARAVDRVAPTLDPHGVSVSDVAAGDVTEADSVSSAMVGCEAVLHCASVYSLDPRDSKKISSTNVRGTEVVIDAGRRAGLDPIVHVSTYGALLPASGILGPGSHVGSAKAVYLRSKADSDLVARRHQEDGAPVVISYPGGVVGPLDPHFTDTNRNVASIVRNRLPFQIRGRLPLADVRYVASGHAAMMERGRGPRRYMLGGHSMPWRELRAVLRRLTGRRLPAIPMPGFLALGTGRLADMMQWLIPRRLAFSYESTWIILNGPTLDDSGTRKEFGLAPPSIEKTLAETIRWMVAAGRLPPRSAGHLGGPANPPGMP